MPSEPSQKLTLGRLEKVDLRTYWCEEDAEFTPWLAQADNIKLLGEAIGMELRVPQEPLHQELSGLPEVDILCQDSSDRWVLIENQLEPTDHHHLGRLLTAMADLQANTVIWIASSFTPEHQTALHWLNRMTAPEVHFFGIEIELWRIGEAVAPKFNLVIQPQRQEAIALTEAVEILPESAPSSLPESPPEPPPEILTDAQRQNLEFWRGLCHQLERRGSIIKPSQPSTESSLSFAIGRAGFRLYTRLESNCSPAQEAPDRDEADLLEPEQSLTVGLMLLGEDAKPHFHLLEEDRQAVESEIGIPLAWDAQGENKSCLIYCGLAGIDLEDRDQWIEYYQWFCVYLEQFHDVFGDRIKRLNANNYQPAPDYSFNPLKSSAVLPGS
ncbi:MAG: DUF4268 domain-containing protein [Oscillatoriophycideae cyanobacterium NC_groundwater_1537_Pr4_S-0.65um_50_18]|nr:DUF4268 domain-containing protein [Oscillatoriophycideae cyanobacterium NC_groundwater_1537_Pr4_S-0.65um_50_18]